jgi:hypothetical protein
MKIGSKEEQRYAAWGVVYQLKNQARMTSECLGLDMIFRYALRKLSRDKMRRYNEHVPGCDFCIKYLKYTDKAPKPILEHLVALQDAIDSEEREFRKLRTEGKLSVAKQFDYLFEDTIEHIRASPKLMKEVIKYGETLKKKLKDKNKD